MFCRSISLMISIPHLSTLFFFFKDTATTDIYTYCHTLSLHDALPICGTCHARPSSGRCGKLPASQLARNRGNQPGLLYRRLCLQSHHPNLSRGGGDRKSTRLNSSH